MQIKKKHDLTGFLSEAFKYRWDEFNGAAKDAGVALPDDPDMFYALRQVFAYSEFVAKCCTRNPKMLMDLIRSGDLSRSYGKTAYHDRLNVWLSSLVHENATANGSPSHSKSIESSSRLQILQQVLRNIRTREMVRIAWRDLAGWADFDETVTDLTRFADACIEKALSFLYEWACLTYGVPTGRSGKAQYLVVIGMGKLGGCELNFSSDIDLILAYPEKGQTTGAKNAMDNDEFFLRLGRQMMSVLGETTSDGILFRVDMRLRPFGESGPLVMAFDAMEEYYQNQGREWERYAWIKARIVAGDKKEGTCLLERLRPFVYRRYLDYGTFESLRRMKHKIAREVHRKGMEDNIKLGWGGIREVEFFGQIFQLIRGGVSPELQENQIRKVLNVLHRENQLSEKVRKDLTDAYVFLRNTEHRLQEFSDRQTHTIPQDAAGRERLAVSSGFADWESFERQLETHRKSVHHHFTNLLETKASRSPDVDGSGQLAGVWQNPSDSSQHQSLLIAAGFNDPYTVLTLLRDFKNDLATRTLSSEGRNRLDRLIPVLLNAVGKSEEPERVLNRLLQLIKTIQKRIAYLSLLLEHPAVTTHLIDLAAASSWIISYVSRHPVLLDELIYPRTAFKPHRRIELENALRQRLAPISRLDLESQMEVLRVFKQAGVLHIAAADISGTLPLMKVSDHLSDLAEAVLKEVLNLSWIHLTEKYGKPTCLLDGSLIESGFTVIAYGKLGGFELGYASDLDLVFLHSGAAGQTSGKAHPIDNTQFFARLGQRVIHMLSAHTPAGILYETDMRLRPSGSSGMLVSHIESFHNYQKAQARTWEHQALVRARAICGNRQMAERFEHIRKEVLGLPRKETSLREDVRNMRERLRNEHRVSDPHTFDLIQGPGGIVDVEFLVQYLVLLNAHRYGELLEWTDNVRLLETLAKTAVIEKDTAAFLKTAYLSYRADAHRLSLQEKSPRVPHSRFRDMRREVENLWGLFITKL